MRKFGFKMSNVVCKPLSIVAIVLLTALVIGSMVVNAATPTGTRLKDIQSRVLIGTEFPSNFNSLSDTATFTSVAAAEFNMVTPENAMKWDATEPSQNNFTYGDADRLVSWAQSHGWKIHGHTLVWHSQTPSWVQNLSASALQSAMYNHIDNVMGHFKGKIVVWDVVNEAFNEDGSYRASFWYNKLGKSFIENAFIRARAADPGAKLIYNDYNLEATGSKSNAAYNMLKDFKSRGIPVDGIGFQMHLDIQYSFNYNDFASNMQRFADLGLEIYITEMDVRVSSNPSSAELQTQADYYKGVIQKCMAQPAVKAIQIWGFTDKYSWVPQTFPGRGAALIFDSNYNPKPAYYAVQTALGSSPVTATPTQRQNTPTPTPTPIPGTISIAAGRTSALGNFQADQYYSGGSTYQNSNTVDVSQITSNPPPAALFNNERYGAMSYTIPGFTAGNSYEVTLYFAETFLTSAGSRRFNVSINGTTVLSNFDIYASAGGQNKAIARTFTA
ncbi:MAG: endo-1,4-beta-xylanase, partial [Firmicutes bacterium]|nr:endo-1,4-beta-xylanase [Bacillota bacterium]